MGAKLKPFNAKAKCPKCGNADVGTFHRGLIGEDPCWYERTYHPVGKWPKHEYLHRSCKRCHYDWPEACAGKP